MTHECSPALKLANCWLSGMTYDDVLKERWYCELPDYVRIQGAHVWIGLDHAYGVACTTMVTNAEQLYNNGWVRRREAAIQRERRRTSRRRSQG